VPKNYKCFVCNISFAYYIYYMQTFAASSRSPFSVVPRLESAFSVDDMVLYRAENGQIAPAVLVQPAGGGCWLARSARNIHGLIYLGPENIVMRLAPVDADLLAEAA
jgi:hypothetical protein